MVKLKGTIRPGKIKNDLCIKVKAEDIVASINSIKEIEELEVILARRKRELEPKDA